MKLTSIYALLFFTFTSCHKIEPQCAAGYKSINNYAIEKHGKDGWFLFGLGGAFDDKIKHLNATFVIKNQEIELTEARVLILKALEELIEHLNKDEKIRNYLSHYPLTYKDINLDIAIFDEHQEFIESEHKTIAAHISALQGKLFYSYHRSNKLTLFHKETYEEAINTNKTTTKTNNT